MYIPTGEEEEYLGAQVIQAGSLSLGETSVGVDLQNIPKTEDEPECMLVVPEKRMAAVGQRGAPKPRPQPERGCHHLLCDHAITLPHSAGEGCGHARTDAAQRLPPAA